MTHLRTGATAPSVFYILLVLSYASPEPLWRAPWPYPESTTQVNPVDIKHMKPEELKEYETILDTVRLIHVACFNEEVYEIIHNIKTDDERDLIVAFYVYKDHDFHYVGSFSANRKIFKAEIINHNHYFVRNFYHLYIGNGRSWVIDKLIMIPHVKADIIEFCDDIHCKCDIDDFDDDTTKKITNVYASGADFGKVGFENNAAAVCGSTVTINKANEENDINIDVLNNVKEDNSDRNQISTDSNNLFKYTYPRVCPYINRLMKPYDSNMKNLQNQNICPCTKLSNLLGLKPCKFMSNSYPFSCKSLVPNIGIATPRSNSITKQTSPSSNAIQKVCPPPQYRKWYNPYLYYATYNRKPNVDHNLYFKQDNYIPNAENSNVISNNAALYTKQVSDNKNNYPLNIASNRQETSITDDNAAVTSKLKLNGQATATSNGQINKKDEDSQFIFADGKAKPLNNNENNKITLPGQQENIINQKPFVIGIDNSIDMFPPESNTILANQLKFNQRPGSSVIEKQSPLSTKQTEDLASSNLTIVKSPNLLIGSFTNVYPSKLTYLQNPDLTVNKNQKLAKDKTDSTSNILISNLNPNTGITTDIDKQKIGASQLNYGKEISKDIRTRYNYYKPLAIAQHPNIVPTIKYNEVKYNDDTVLGSAGTDYTNQNIDGSNKIQTVGEAEYENAEIGSNINLSPGSRRMIATNYKQNVFNPDVFITPDYKRSNNRRIRLYNQNLNAVNNNNPNEVFAYSSPKQRMDVKPLITSPSKLSLSPLNANMKALQLNGELIKNGVNPKASIEFKLPEYKIPNDRTDETENINVYRTDAETDSFFNGNKGLISQNMENPASYYGDRGFISATYKIPKGTNTHVPMNINYDKYIGLNYLNGTPLSLGQLNSATVIPNKIDAFKMYQETYAPKGSQQAPHNNFDLNNDRKVSYDEFSSTLPKNTGFNVEGQHNGAFPQYVPNIQYSNKATNPSQFDENNTQLNEALYKPLDINTEPDVTGMLKENGYPLYLQQDKDFGQEGKYKVEPYTDGVNNESTGNIGLIYENESNTETAYTDPNDAPIYNPQINIGNNKLDTLENNEFLNKSAGKISYVGQPNLKPLKQLNTNEKKEKYILTQENKSIDLPITQQPGQVYQYPDDIRTNSGMENVSDIGFEPNDEENGPAYKNEGTNPQQNEIDKNINENSTIEAHGFKTGFVNVNDSLKNIKGTNIVIKEKPTYMQAAYTDDDKNDSPTQDQLKYPGAITENNTDRKTFNEIVDSKPIIVSDEISVNQKNNDDFSNKTLTSISLGPSSADSLNIQTEPYKYTELNIMYNEDQQNYTPINLTQYDVVNIHRDRVINSLSLDEIQPDHSFINRDIDNYKMSASERNLTLSLGQADKIIGVNNIPNQNYASGDTKPLIFNQKDDRQTTDIDKFESNYKSRYDEIPVSESEVLTNFSLGEIQPNDSFINENIGATSTIDNYKVSNPGRNLTPILGGANEANDINNIQNQHYASGGYNPVSYNQRDERQTPNIGKYESYYVPDSNYKLRYDETPVSESEVPADLNLNVIEPNASLIYKDIGATSTFDNYKISTPERNLTPSFREANYVNNIPNQDHVSGEYKPLSYNQKDDSKTTKIDKYESYYIPNSNYKLRYDETPVSGSVVPNYLNLEEMQPSQSFKKIDIGTTSTFDNYNISTPERNLAPSLGEANEFKDVNNTLNQDYSSGDGKPVSYHQRDDSQTPIIDEYESYYVPNSNYKSHYDGMPVTEINSKFRRTNSNIGAFDSIFNEVSNEMTPLSVNQLEENDLSSSDQPKTEIIAKNKNDETPQINLNAGENVVYPQITPNLQSVGEGISNLYPLSNRKPESEEIKNVILNVYDNKVTKKSMYTETVSPDDLSKPYQLEKNDDTLNGYSNDVTRIDNDMSSIYPSLTQPNIQFTSENNDRIPDLNNCEIFVKTTTNQFQDISRVTDKLKLYQKPNVFTGTSENPTKSYQSTEINNLNSDQDFNANNYISKKTSYDPTPLVINSGPDKYINSNSKPTLISNYQPNQSNINTNPTQEDSASKGNNNDETTPSDTSISSSTTFSNSNSFPLYKNSILDSTMLSIDNISYTNTNTAQRFSESIENSNDKISQSYTSILPPTPFSSSDSLPSRDDTSLNSNPTQGFSASNKTNDRAEGQDTGQVTDELKFYQKPNLCTETNENPTKLYQSTDYNNLNGDQDLDLINLREETTFNPTSLVINSAPDKYIDSNLKPSFLISNYQPTQTNMNANPTQVFPAFSENNNDKTNPFYISVPPSTLSSNTDSFSLHKNSISARTPPTDDILPNANPTQGFLASNKNNYDTEFQDKSPVTDEIKLYQKPNVFTGTNENPTKLYQRTDYNNLYGDQDFNVNNNLREETSSNPTPLVISSGPDKYMKSNLKPTFLVSNYKPTQEFSASNENNNDGTIPSYTFKQSSKTFSNSDYFPFYENSKSGSTMLSTDISPINTYSTQIFSASNDNNEITNPSYSNSNSFSSHKNSISDSTLEFKDKMSYTDTNSVQTSQSYTSTLPSTSFSNVDAFPLFTNSISDRTIPSPAKISPSTLNFLKIASPVSSLLPKQQLTYGSSSPSRQSLLTSASSFNNINPFSSQSLLNQPTVPLPQTQSIILNNLRSNLLSYLKSNVNILDNAAIGIPLGDIGVAKYDATEDTKYFTVNTENDDINLKAWYSKLKLIKAKVTFETIEGDVLNFMPIVNNPKYCPVKVQEIAKNAISKVYGEPIVVQGFSFDDPYAVVDIDSACIYNGSYVVLWPTFCYRD